MSSLLKLFLISFILVPLVLLMVLFRTNTQKSWKEPQKILFNDCNLIFSFVICLHLVQTFCHCIGNFARQISQYCASRWWKKEGCLFWPCKRWEGRWERGTCKESVAVLILYYHGVSCTTWESHFVCTSAKIKKKKIMAIFISFF